MASYREQLKDPRWQKRRLVALERAGWACENCGDKTTTLHVHHKHYIKGRQVWDYPHELLAVLCEACHQQEHAELAILNELLSQAEPGCLSGLVGLVCGFLDGNVMLDRELACSARDGRQSYYEIGVAASLLFGADVRRETVRRLSSGKPAAPAVRWLLEKWDDPENPGL